MWLVLGATVIVASLFAGRSDRARLVARVALGVLFLVFGALVNVIYLLTDWDSFADFGEMSSSPSYVTPGGPSWSRTRGCSSGC